MRFSAQKNSIYECVSDGWHHVLWFPEVAVKADANNPDYLTS